MEPAGNPAATELQERRDAHKATIGRGGPDMRDTETGDRNGQRALLECGQPENANDERRSSEMQSMLNMRDHHGEEGGGGPLTQQHAPTTCSQGIEGESPTRKCSPPARRQGMEEGGGSPIQQRALPTRSQGRAGDTPTRQRAILARNQGTKEGGKPPPE